ncbi:MAG TPA: beta-ketoacyl synthase N-terminal-like domain-containing protein, partial [Kofleriaceae bacterium]|nr:beta-ketoacyl synthase N-terminal-like domain-containing protein [Kofleriaceae bacterium]
GLDPCSRYLTGAAALALADAGMRTGGAAGQKMGLVAGVNHVSAESNAALVRTIRDRGYRGMSASLFSRMVLNAPVGTCSKLLGIKGALSTVSAGDAAGLLAILYAAELAATRPELDAILAGGVDELPPGDVAPGAGEGAACVVLAGTRPAARTAVRLAGSGIAGPGRIEAAARAALAAAALEPDALDAVVGTVPAALVPAAVRRIDPDELAGASEAFTSALAFVIGSLLVRSGAARRVLVARAGGGSADCAIALVREEELHAA